MNNCFVQYFYYQRVVFGAPDVQVQTPKPVKCDLEASTNKKRKFAKQYQEAVPKYIQTRSKSKPGPQGLPCCFEVPHGWLDAGPNKPKWK